MEEVCEREDLQRALRRVRARSDEEGCREGEAEGALSVLWIAKRTGIVSTPRKPQMR